MEMKDKMYFLYLVKLHNIIAASNSEKTGVLYLAL